jgi:hypothetical protein
LATCHYFSSCLATHDDVDNDDNDDEDAEVAVEWSQMESVLRLVSETSALTLRDEMVTFVGFNEKHPCVVRSLAEIEQADILNSLKKKEEEEEKVGNESITKEDTTTDISPLDSTDITPRSDSDFDSEEWSVVFPGGSQERKLIHTHARIWLLHDFDHLQKWRCRYIEHIGFSNC